MLQPLVSVVLPVYNAELFLAKAINSILQQTYITFEFIIINDGSTDGSERIILSFNDSRIRYIKNETNLKLIATLNKGITLAQGAYIARMDADDEAHPNRLHQQVAYMQTNPNVGALGTYAKRIDVRTGKVTNWKFPTTHQAMVCRMFWGSTIIHPTAIIRAEALAHLNFKEDYLHAEDYKLWKDIAQSYQLANLPEFLLNYTQHAGQITTTQQQGMNATCFKINEEWLTQLNAPLPKELVHLYQKFLTYDFSNWNNNDIVQLINFAATIHQQNNLLHVFDTDLFAQQLAERVYFLVFNTASSSNKGLAYYKASVFNKILPLKLNDSIKYYYKRLL